MPVEDEAFLNGVRRTQTIYQQPSTGEKHVLFYPTSPAPSVNSEERRRWSLASSSVANKQSNTNHKASNNNTGTVKRMKKSEGAASDPPDTGGHQLTDPSTSDGLQSRYNFKIGIYGWRKRCLYILILVLLVMVIVNLALTLWVLKVMEFSSEGMGQLKIVSGGLQLNGKAFVFDSLIASSIRSRIGKAITIESSRNLTLSSRNKNGHLDNFIFLGNDRFECLANNFKIMDDSGTTLFSADHNEVVVGASTLRVTGEGGTRFSGSVQTSHVRSQPGHDLRLESPTRSLEIHAPQGIRMDSRGGKIDVTALNDLSLKSEVGSIILDSSSVVIPKLKTAVPSSRASQPRNHEIYQLCICNNGKLFLSRSDTLCSSNDDDVICR